VIETLRIENLAIVDRAELEFGPGLNVLTGETGAGKSIVLGALALLAGARASADAVRAGCEEAGVEAVFDTRRLPDLEAELERRGLPCPDHQLVVRRTFASGGRSRARVGGEIVPVSLLGELFAGRIEISSQHDSQSLRRPELHGWLLDRVGGLLELREAVAGGVSRLRALDEELAQLRERAREREQRADFLAFQVREIEAAKLDADEIARLRAERSRLAHAERLREEGGAAIALLAGDVLGAEAAGAADLAAEAARRLAALQRLDPGLADLAERVASLQAELREAALELERSVSGIEADPARLAALEERLHGVERLARKYGGDLEAVARHRDAAAAELASLAGDETREGELLREREPLRDRLERDARALSAGRVRAAGELARRVQASLRELAMPQARFAISLDPAPPPTGLPCGPAGLEAPEFQLSASQGEPLRPLRRVASGGELSRALLALKNAARAGEAGMVLVFDEVDAGVGGRAADRVGRSLAELAGQHQVLCITHLPQIAAFADTHLRVEKLGRAGRARVAIVPVSGRARIEEIARMAGGESVGAETLAHARALLDARERPQDPRGD
jgi:DNA repair protein RecN (Recombination protein N)